MTGLTNTYHPGVTLGTQDGLVAIRLGEHVLLVDGDELAAQVSGLQRLAENGWTLGDTGNAEVPPDRDTRRDEQLDPPIPDRHAHPVAATDDSVPGRLPNPVDLILVLHAEDLLREVQLGHDDTPVSLSTPGDGSRSVTFTLATYAAGGDSTKPEAVAS